MEHEAVSKEGDCWQARPTGADLKDVPPTERRTKSGGWEDAFIGFCETTSAHGISQMSRDSKARNIAWMIVVIVACCAAIVGIVSIITEYFEYNYTELSKTESNPQLKFPAVTVCNEMPYSTTDLQPTKEYFEAIGIGNASCKNEFYTPSEQIDEVMKSRFFHNHRQNVLFQYDPNITKVAGQREEEFLVRCFYQGTSCTKNVNMSLFEDPNHYNCLTFNIAPEKAKKYKESGSLDLTLFVGDAQINQRGPLRDLLHYSGDLGLKVMIHPEGTHPYMSKTITVTVGQKAQIILKPKRYQRLRHPYTSKCIEDPAPINSDDEQKSFTYTKELCILKCYYDLVSEKCGCLPDPPIADKLGFDFPYCGGHPCNVTKATKNVKCHRQIREDFIENTLPCDHCQLPCVESQFDADVRLKKYPSQFSFQQVKRMYWSMANGNVSEHLWNNPDALQDYIERNVAVVSVYFENSEVTLITEHALLTWFSCVSNVGGFLGICIGMSAISIMEVIEFLVKLCLKARENQVQTM